jgi:hypothetical protein
VASINTRRTAFYAEENKISLYNSDIGVSLYKHCITRERPPFTVSEGSSPCSQDLASGPYPKPPESTAFSLNYILILSFYQRLHPASDFFDIGSPTKILQSISHISDVC